MSKFVSYVSDEYHFAHSSHDLSHENSASEIKKAAVPPPGDSRIAERLPFYSYLNVGSHICPDPLFTGALPHTS